MEQLAVIVLVGIAVLDIALFVVQIWVFFKQRCQKRWEDP